MTTKAQLTDLIEELMLNYPDATYAWRGNMERVAEMWERSLGELPAEVVIAAVRRWVDSQPKLPHVSDIRAMIAEAVTPIPSEGEVWSRRFAYFRHGRGEAMQDEDAFAFAVFADVGSAVDCGQMPPDDLRESVKWAYKRRSERERTERTATVAGALEPAIAEPRLRVLGS
jgi:hypothetical protein